MLLAWMAIVFHLESAPCKLDVSDGGLGSDAELIVESDEADQNQFDGYLMF